MTLQSPRHLPNDACAPERDPPGSYFRHHGAWAPGVRLFRRLRFRGKALIMGGVILVPLALALALLLGYWNSRIAFTEKRLSGLATLNAYVPAVRAIVETRNIARGTLGGFDGAADYAAARQAADKALADFETGIAAAGDPLAVMPELKALRAEWGRSAKDKNGADPSGALPFAPAWTAAMGLWERIGDSAGLMLDADIDSFYLVNATVLTLPKTLDALGQLWGWGTYAIARGGIGPNNIADWNVWSARVAGGVEDAKSYFARAEKANPALPAKMGAAAFKSALGMRELGQHAVFDDNPPDVKAYFAQGRQAIADMAGIYATTLPVIEGLLREDARALRTQRALAVCVALASLALLSYFAVSFRKVLEGGLREIARHIEAMRNGDLTTRPHAWGSDEVADLIRAVGQMRLSLRRIVEQVRHASSSVLDTSHEIKATSGDLSQRTEQAAANLQQTAATMEEISSTVRNTAANVQQAAHVASGNSAVATRAHDIVGQVVGTMQDIHSSSQRIGDIIGTIDGIAFQTNILALNAAVEAARAGEQGRGFAVVAGEVRTLAQRSAVAAKEIKQLITDSVRRVDSGAKTVRIAGDIIGELVSNAQSMNGLLHEIEVASNQQSRALGEIGSSVQDLDKLTQRNAAIVQQSGVSAHELGDRATSLAGEVAIFVLE